MSELLIYGTGYSGELMAERAVAVGLRPVLAGRSAEKVRPVAARLGCEARIFGLDDPAAIDRGLDGVRVVVHCAGPFIRTYAPMVDACLRRGAHYLDITGEIDVFEALRARDTEARSRGVMLLPGVGQDVVPTECLAAHTARRVEKPVRLALALWAKTRPSRGSAKTMIDSIVERGLVVREGKLVPVPPFWKKRAFEFEGRQRPATTFPMAELSACHASTGIPEIETYIVLPRAAGPWTPLLRHLAPIVRRPTVKRLLTRRIEAMKLELSPEERGKGRGVVVAEVEDASGSVARSRLYLPEPYTLTALAGVLCAQKALAAAKPGYQTPSTAFGPDLVLEIEGVRREDA